MAQVYDDEQAHGRGGPADDDGAWEDDPPRVPEAALVATFVLGVVSTLVVVLTWWLLTSNDEATPAQAGVAGSSELRDASPTDASPTASPTDGTTEDGTAGDVEAAASRLERCRSADSSLTQALDAAGPALRQWEVHVGAMNQLVIGEITLQQASDFWNRTRVGARRKVEAFHATMGSLRREGVDCPAPDLLAPGDGSLLVCARRVDAEVDVLRAARTSITTWGRHVEDMDMLRMGDLSPEEATRMWLSMWRQGVRDLRTYRSADREARALDGCTDADAEPAGS